MASALTLTLLVPLVILSIVEAQVPMLAPEPMPVLDCSGALLNLSACLTYVTSGSNLTRPDKGCCGALAGVVANEAICVCQLIASSGSYGVDVDTVRALTLPTICRVDAPPTSLCAALGVPVGSVSPPSGGAGDSGSGTQPTTPTTTYSSPAKHKASSLLHFALPCCAMLFLTLLF